MLEKVWIRHHRLFGKIALSIIDDSSAVDDVLQDTYTNILRRQREFATEEEAFNYLRRSIINASIDYYRRVCRTRSRFASLQSLDLLTLSSGRLDPERLVLEKERERCRREFLEDVRLAVSKLSTQQRQAIDLIFGSHNDKTLKEVCKEKGIPYSTLRSRMLAGVDRIRRYLRESDSNVPVQEKAESHELPGN